MADDDNTIDETLEYRDRDKILIRLSGVEGQIKRWAEPYRHPETTNYPADEAAEFLSAIRSNLEHLDLAPRLLLATARLGTALDVARHHPSRRTPVPEHYGQVLAPLLSIQTELERWATQFPGDAVAPAVAAALAVLYRAATSARPGAAVEIRLARAMLPPTGTG